jgi:hypothetical protein
MGKTKPSKLAQEQPIVDSESVSAPQLGSIKESEQKMEQPLQSSEESTPQKIAQKIPQPRKDPRKDPRKGALKTKTRRKKARQRAKQVAFKSSSPYATSVSGTSPQRKIARAQVLDKKINPK